MKIKSKKDVEILLKMWKGIASPTLGGWEIVYQVEFGGWQTIEKTYKGEWRIFWEKGSWHSLGWTYMDEDEIKKLIWKDRKYINRFLENKRKEVKNYES